jgi:hypothetical protein
VNELQTQYLDSAAVAAAHGLAANTVRGGGGLHVPEPDVVLGGLQLWIRAGSEATELASRSID